MKFPPLSVALVCAAFLSAPGLASAGIGPRITFATNEYHFGKVVAGEIVHYTFIVSNAGDETLDITKVSPSCHCTTAGEWARHMEPGKTGEIPIKFDSGNFHGEDITKLIAVYSNDRLAPMKTLYLRGTIWKAVDVKPQFAYIVINPDAISNATSVVHITNQLDQPITLSEPVSVNSSFKAEIRTIIPGKDFEVLIRAVPPFKTGNNVGKIRVGTSLTNIPSVEITAIAMMQKTIGVTPEQITLPAALPNWSTNIITLAANGARTLALSDLQVSDPRVLVQLKETTPGKAFQLYAAFPPGYQIPRGHDVKVTLKSNSTAFPLVTIPITQMQPPPAMHGASANPLQPAITR